MASVDFYFHFWLVPVAVQALFSAWLVER